MGQITTIHDITHEWCLEALEPFAPQLGMLTQNSSCLIEVCHKVDPNSSNQFIISTKCLSERMRTYEPFLLCLVHISSPKSFTIEGGLGISSILFLYNRDTDHLQLILLLSSTILEKHIAPKSKTTSRKIDNTFCGSKIMASQKFHFPEFIYILYQIYQRKGQISGKFSFSGFLKFSHQLPHWIP